MKEEMKLVIRDVFFIIMFLVLSYISYYYDKILLSIFFFIVVFSLSVRLELDIRELRN